MKNKPFTNKEYDYNEQKYELYIYKEIYEDNKDRIMALYDTIKDVVCLRCWTSFDICTCIHISRKI